MQALNLPLASLQATCDGFEVLKELDGWVVDALEFGLDIVPVESDDAEPARALSYRWDDVFDVHVSAQ